MKTATFAVAVSALAVGGFGWFDTASYRSAVQAYQAVARVHATQGEEQVRQDEVRYRRCDPMRTDNRTSNTVDFTPEGRACLIDALGRTGSVPGALVLLRNASVALSKDPDDSQLRAAALGAIDRARKILVGDQAYYDGQEQIKQAYANSLVMRMLGEPEPSAASFADQAALLDQAEYAIHLPKLYQSQQIWRLESLLPEKGRAPGATRQAEG